MEAVLRSYWGDRPESLETCAVRLKQMLDGLAEIDEAFTHWFLGGRTKAESFTPLGRGLDELTAHLDQKRDHESWGYSGGAWSGQDDGAAFDVRAGEWSTSPRVQISNLANVDFPTDVDSERLYEPGPMLQVASVVIEAWAPETLAITSWDWWEPQLEVGKFRPVGWVTWVNGERAGLVPAGVGEPFAGGVLIRAADSFNETTTELTLELLDRLIPTGAIGKR